MSPRQTTTEPPSRPRIERTNLVWAGGVPEFVTRRAIDGAGAGDAVTVGVRAGLRVSHGNLTPRFDVTVRDDDGADVAETSVENAHDVDDGRYVVRDYWVRVDVSDLPPATYTAAVTLTDTFQGWTTEPATFEFELREPLGEDEVRLTDYRPEEWRTGEPIRWTLELSNLTSTANSIVGRVDYSTADAAGWVGLDTVSWHLPAGGTGRHRTGRVTIDESAELTFRVRSADLRWETSVQSPNGD